MGLATTGLSDEARGSVRRRVRGQVRKREKRKSVNKTSP